MCCEDTGRGECLAIVRKQTASFESRSGGTRWSGVQGAARGQEILTR
jgi:hypothetical protein